MNKKIVYFIPCLALAFLVFGQIIVAMANAYPTSEPAPYPSILISPQGISEVNVGETFTVTVSVSGLAGRNLYGFDIVLTWDTDALEYVSHEAKVPVETYAGGILHQPILDIKNEVDVSAGTYWIAYASVLPAEPFNEDGTFFAITFVCLGTSDEPFTLEHVVLVSKRGELIPLENYQNPEIPTPTQSFSSAPSWLRLVRNMKWLEWWITITTGIRCRIVLSN